MKFKLLFVIHFLLGNKAGNTRYGVDLMDILKEYTLSASGLKKEQILYNDNINFKPHTEIFSPKYWESQQAIYKQTKGRGSTYVFNYQEKMYVLKHYQRGGLLAPFLKDLYFCNPVMENRAWRECKLLTYLGSIPLPVPRPAAARIVKKGFIYTGDIITEYIPDCTTLAALILKGEKIEDRLWCLIGACIKSFHSYGVYHADLNSENILIDKEQKVWLIDFDRCVLHKPNSKRLRSNLSRLKRSISKLVSQKSSLAFPDLGWTNLLLGYNKS